MKILIIDDDPFTCSLLKIKIKEVERENQSIDIRSAASLKNADEVMKDFKPDIIMLDLNLKGFSFVNETLRAIHRLSGIAITIIISGDYREDMPDRCLAQGALEFIHKDELTFSGLIKKLVHAYKLAEYRQELEDSK